MKLRDYSKRDINIILKYGFPYYINKKNINKKLKIKLINNKKICVKKH